MESATPTIDNLIELALPSDPQIAPDGSAIAYTVSQPDWEENAYVSQIWLVENKPGAKPRQLTFSKSGSGSPRWSPQGQHLAFLSERDGDEGAQIYRLSINGGEAEHQTELETGIQSFQWSPDGQTIAFTAVPPESPADKDRTSKFGEYVEDNVDYKRSHLWLLNVADKKVRQLTAGHDFHVREFEWNPDSQRLAITTMPSPDMGQLLEKQIQLLDVTTLTLQTITPLNTFVPRWSPDGTALVYQRAPEGPGAFYKNGWLETLTLATQRIEPVAMTFDEDPELLDWSNDGIYFAAIQRTSVHLFRVDATGGVPVQVTPSDMDGFVGMSFSFSSDFAHCGLTYADSNRLDDVASLTLLDGELQRLTDYDAQARDWNLPQHESYSWTSTDGTEIEGILTRPVDFDPQKKYPLLVVIHGGPTGISLLSPLGYATRRIYPTYQWLSQGAIILQPNYRGSAGYGEAFRSLNVGNLGIGDYADVISGVDGLIAEGWVDSERIGAMGWSQGGYISAFITTYSNRFKAVSVGAGISNWMTYYVNTDIHPFTQQYLEATPWDNPEIYAKTSPVTYIKNARTPTLIQHGEKDARVPVPNAFELHQGLLDQGVESKLVVYPGMPHGPNKPKQARHILNDNLAWFNRQIFGIESETIEPAPLYIVVPGIDKDGTLVANVANLARRDSATFRVLAADGILSDDQSIQTTEWSISNAATGAQKIADQLIELSVKKIMIYTEKASDNSAVLIALGCVQIAAGSIGGIVVEHHEGSV